MSEKDYQFLLNALRQQRKEVTSSKRAAKKFLAESGILRLLVPKVLGKSPATAR